MDSGIREEIQSPEIVSWRLVKEHLLGVKAEIRKSGGKIDHRYAFDDLACWKRHPEYFPEEFRGRVTYLWNTLESQGSFHEVEFVLLDRRGRVESHRQIFFI
ncbi:MAG: hypothetical protein AAB719_02750 [Patescibacteria group bacterium]